MADGDRIGLAGGMAFFKDRDDLFAGGDLTRGKRGAGLVGKQRDKAIAHPAAHHPGDGADLEPRDSAQRLGLGNSRGQLIRRVDGNFEGEADAPRGVVGARLAVILDQRRDDRIFSNRGGGLGGQFGVPFGAGDAKVGVQVDGEQCQRIQRPFWQGPNRCIDGVRREERTNLRCVGGARL